MEKRTKKWLVTTGVAMAATAVSSYALTIELMRIAIHRDGLSRVKNIGKAKNYLRGFHDKEEFLNVLMEHAARLEERDLKQVEITASDGEHLVGHFYPCEHPKRVILAMHGWRSTWSRDFGVIADFWHESDCHVLFIEQRGQNNSGGQYMSFGIKERFDCLDWLKWVVDHTDETLPIYLAGASMGATTVLMAGGQKLPLRVRGIMADCGFTSPEAIWKHVLHKNLHISYNIRKHHVEQICKKNLNMKASEYSTLEALRHNELPVLFIHGADDHFVPVEMTYENYKACKGPKRLLIVPGADHGMSYYINPEEYEACMRGFWADFDCNFAEKPI